ncbi:MAG: hypothetical protein V3S49_04965 [Thermodesulfobacteriota bacterium]
MSEDKTEDTESPVGLGGQVEQIVSCGFYEGETCNRNRCHGIIEERPVENCSCNLCPPCSACTTPRAYCSECGWEESDEPIEEPKYVGKPWTPSRPKPLDNAKIDWRWRGHTHFSMIKYGVYPEGTTAEEVRKKVNGTFGGRFNHFGGGKFEFVAYTD